MTAGGRRLVVTILGCASSGGVPRVGGGWGACDPSNAKNRRRRCSILVEQAGSTGSTIVLVDTSPDLREQLLGEDVTRIDGVLITHEHADHTHGIDDLRPLAIHMRRRIDLWADDRTTRFLHRGFGYCFATPEGSDYPPILNARRIDVGVPVVVGGPGGDVFAEPFEMVHGNTMALGFRFGPLAYASDVSHMPETSVARLEGLEVLIVDALRYRPHPTHFNLEDALGLIARVRPKRAVLTNLHNDLDYERLASELPDGVQPAYDGMRITLALAAD